jgi:hypothetical protein
MQQEWRGNGYETFVDPPPPPEENTSLIKRKHNDKQIRDMGWQYVNPNCSRIRRGQVAGTYNPWDCTQPHNFLIGRINYKFSRNTNEVIVVNASLEFLTNTSTQSGWLTLHQMKRLLTDAIRLAYLSYIFVWDEIKFPVGT